MWQLAAANGCLRSPLAILKLLFCEVRLKLSQIRVDGKCNEQNKQTNKQLLNLEPLQSTIVKCNCTATEIVTATNENAP